MLKYQEINSTIYHKDKYYQEDWNEIEEDKDSNKTKETKDSIKHGYNFSQKYVKEKDHDFLIQFGFPKSSIEICLKYDLFEEMGSIMMSNPNKKKM